MLNQKGFASIEMIPVLLIFILLVNFGLGFFGVIHSGILNSIAARNYAFESFRNRANLNYLRDEGGDLNPYFSKEGFRFHSVVAEDSTQVNRWIATKRPIKFLEVQTGVVNIASSSDHNVKVRQKLTDEKKKTSEVFKGQSATGGDAGVSPVWLMQSYGICLNSACGGT